MHNRLVLSLSTIEVEYVRATSGMIASNASYLKHTQEVFTKIFYYYYYHCSKSIIILTMLELGLGAQVG